MIVASATPAVKSPALSTVPRAWPKELGSPRGLIPAALHAFVPWRMRQLRLDGQRGEHARQNTEIIFNSFLLGAQGSFTDGGAPAFEQIESQLPWTRRHFFWEGHSFGLAARSACTLSKAKVGAGYLAPGFRFMFFTGLGFWNAVATRFLLPRVPLGSSPWQGVGDFSLGLPFLAGGESFGAVALEGQLARDTIEGLDRGAPEDTWRRPGILLGAGRALWFLYMDDFARLGAILSDSGADARSIAEGLGLAMTFTQLGDPRRVLASIDKLPKSFRQSARVGSMAALAGAAEDDPRMGDSLALLPDPLPSWFREGVKALRHAERDHRFFATFLDALYDAAI